MRHLQMKSQLAKRFESISRIEFELPIIEGHRADIVLLDLDIAIECQASPISIEEWQFRTQNYSAENYRVMWVWDICRVYGKRMNFFPEPENYWESGQTIANYRLEYRVPAEIRHCHAWNEQIFALDSAGRLMVCRFLDAAERYNEWFDEDGEERYSYYTPKTLKRILQSYPIGKLQDYIAGQYKLVCFNGVIDRLSCGAEPSDPQHGVRVSDAIPPQPFP
jgi:hypothetical protein